MSWLDKLPWLPLAIAAVALGLAPFVPEPHLFEKLRLLFSGQLHMPLDIFDLCLHAAAPALLIAKAIRKLMSRS